MANENGSTYELHYGVKVLCDEKADASGYALMRANQLEALTTLIASIEPTDHPDSLIKDVMWLASSVADEIKHLLKVVYEDGVAEGMMRTQKQKQKQKPKSQSLAATH